MDSTFLSMLGVPSSTIFCTEFLYFDVTRNLLGVLLHIVIIMDSLKRLDARFN